MTRKTAARITIAVMVLASFTYCALLKFGIAPPPQDTFIGIGLFFAAAGIAFMTGVAILVSGVLLIMDFLSNAFEG